MPRVGFEPTISAGERPKTYALDRAATGTGHISGCLQKLTTRLLANAAQVVQLYGIQNSVPEEFTEGGD